MQRFSLCCSLKLASSVRAVNCFRERPLRQSPLDMVQDFFQNAATASVTEGGSSREQAVRPEPCEISPCARITYVCRLDELGPEPGQPGKKPGAEIRLAGAFCRRQAGPFWLHGLGRAAAHGLVADLLCPLA